MNTTREEIDVVSCSPALSLSTSSTSEIRLPDLPEEDEMMEVENAENVYLNEEEKKYYCQRCLNHGMHYPRKGHKPKCKFLNCTCEDCYMVEQRRQLNNMLSRKKVRSGGGGSGDQQAKGPRIRDPQCARCGAHGVKIPLRGHKRSMCQFSTCTCATCALVENRRTLMAKQIKLRRDQQKGRGIVTVAAARKPKAPKKVAAERPRRSGSTNCSPSSSVSFSSTCPQSPTLPIMFPPPATPFPGGIINSAFSPVLPSVPLVLPSLTLEQTILLRMFVEMQSMPPQQQ